MKDIPVFTTENGVANLVLKEIPYSAIAYVRILDTLSPEQLLEECVSFCRVVGAEKILATGHPALECYPLYTSIWEMDRYTEGLPETDAVAIPVADETLTEWRDIYNTAMRHVDNASYMSIQESKKMLCDYSLYYIYRNDKLLGIGMVSGNTIEAVASLVPGAGQDILLSLTRLVAADSVSLQVASTNLRAIRLYEKLGFFKKREISRWYKIF